MPFGIHDALGDGYVRYEACKPVLRQSVPFCLKELDCFFF